jgi:alpha-1,6-mannosyltransferase
MRIVHIANFYGPNSGGIKTTLHELGRGYLKYGHDFIYIVPGTQFYQEQTPYGRKITLPSVILPGSGSYRIIKSNKALRELVRELAPDRIEISDRFTLRGMGKFAKAQGIPTVVFSHETLRGLANRFLPAWLPRKALVNWHNKRLAKSFDHVIATTEFAAAEFREIGTKNLVKIPLGVDLVNFSPDNRSLIFKQELLKGSQVLLVHCGRLSPEKEPQRSIEALTELRARGIDARLVIVGIGPMWKKIRLLAKDLPVDTLGYIADRKRVAAILSSADVSLAPGPLETFCLSALESIASGTPVVASESSAVGEFLKVNLKHPAGAVAADNGVAFADAIESLLYRPKLRAVARSAAEALPWDKTIQLMMLLHGIEGIGSKAPSVITKRKLMIAS